MLDSLDNFQKTAHALEQGMAKQYCTGLQLMNSRQKILRFIGKKPPELCVVTPLPEIANYSEEMARQIGISTCIAISKLENDLEVALDVIRNENISLLATRGYTEYILRSKTDIPILSIGYSAENFLETLLPYQNSGITVGHLCFPGQGLKFMKVASLLGLKGIRIEVKDRNNIKKVLDSVKNENISLFIGGLGLITQVLRNGFKGIPLLSENREVVMQTFLDAQSMLAFNKINKEKHYLIRTILDINPNIIIYADESLTITYANRTARNIFSSLRRKLPGTHLSFLFPDSDFPALFGEALAGKEPGILQDRSKREFLFDLTEINQHGKLDGYILSLNSVQNVQRNERALRKKQNFPTTIFTLQNIIGESDAIKSCKKLSGKYAASDEPVLITGETGVGKEMFAQAIHAMSNRKNNPFFALNCASLSETLLESELFGYEDGAFTGAKKGGKQGILEMAKGGTLFLDEIGEMPPCIQARLLRVLQDQTIRQLGSTNVITVDVRIISATNRDLEAMLSSGQFRSDLYFRINTLRLHLPPLSERREDIAAIAKAFASSNNYKISKNALAKLENHNWKGNARELVNIIKRAIIMTSSRLIEEEDIIFDKTEINRNSREYAPRIDAGRIRKALENNQYNREATARELGMSRTTLWKLMKLHSLTKNK